MKGPLNHSHPVTVTEFPAFVAPWHAPGCWCSIWQKKTCTPDIEGAILDDLAAFWGWKLATLCLQAEVVVVS